MRNLIRAWLIALCLGAATPAVAKGPLGLGILLGEPTAVTGKYFLDDKHAIDAGMSFALDRWLLIYSDYLMHFHGAIKVPELSDVTPYFGFGAFFVLSNKTTIELRKERYFAETSDSNLAVGVRIPVGLEWRPNYSIGAFLELGPGITIVPSTTAFLQGGIGVRYYF